MKFNYRIITIILFIIVLLINNIEFFDNHDNNYYKDIESEKTRRNYEKCVKLGDCKENNNLCKSKREQHLPECKICNNCIKKIN